MLTKTVLVILYRLTLKKFDVKFVNYVNLW